MASSRSTFRAVDWRTPASTPALPPTISAPPRRAARSLWRPRGPSVPHPPEEAHPHEWARPCRTSTRCRRPWRPTTAAEAPVRSFARRGPPRSTIRAPPPPDATRSAVCWSAVRSQARHTTRRPPVEPTSISRATRAQSRPVTATRVPRGPLPPPPPPMTAVCGLPP